jgi:hypothetical protein
MKRLRGVTAFALLLLITGAVSLHAQDKRRIHIFSKYSDGKPAGTAKEPSRVISAKAAEWLSRQYPCYGVLTDEAIKTAIEYDKNGQLQRKNTGGVFGSSEDAEYLIVFEVSGVGDGWSVSGQVIDRRWEKVRSTRQVTLDSTEDAAFEARVFAQEFITGLELQKCKDWNGSVVVKIIENHDETTPSSVKVHTEGKATLTCTLTGLDQIAHCSYTSRREMRTEFNSIVTGKSASDESVLVRVSVTGNKLTLTIGQVPVTVKVSDTKGTPNLDPYKDTLNARTYELPARPGAAELKDSWTDPLPANKELGVEHTVQWNLRKN